MTESQLWTNIKTDRPNWQIQRESELKEFAK
jgi:hypothetical protein